ncbi:hypothetical protein BC940DRAFT_299800 [Gongronella butleri]|nr:hypothetical protein BC940DRAFT_299800 [Gongronella butleri]
MRDVTKLIPVSNNHLPREETSVVLVLASRVCFAVSWSIWRLQRSLTTKNGWLAGTQCNQG